MRRYCAIKRILVMRGAFNEWMAARVGERWRQTRTSLLASAHPASYIAKRRPLDTNLRRLMEIH